MSNMTLKKPAPVQASKAAVRAIHKVVAELIEEAVKAEREACAKLCWEVGVSLHHAMYAADVADLIRARGENK